MRGPFSRLRRHGGTPAAAPMGVYVDAKAPPHGLSETIHANQLAGMTADAGLRLAGSRGKRTYTGGGLTLHSFVGGQGGPASEAVLDALPLQTGNRRRAIGTFRGTPDGGWPTNDGGD